MAGNVPVGVKVVSIIYYIGAGFELLLGIAFFIGAGALGSLAQTIPLLGALGSAVFVVAGILLVGLGILSIFIGRGLWKAQNWARITAIVFSALGVLMAISGMAQGKITSNVLGLALNAAIAGYLLFSKEVKAAFA